MEDRKNQPLRARVRFALAGLAHACRSERSLRTQILAVALVLGGLLWLRPPPLWWAVVLLATAAVLAAELFNTALERLADHLHPQLHAEIRIVKDCAAAAVLCLAIGAVGVAIALIWQQLT